MQDCNPSSSRLSSSDHVFLASGFPPFSPGSVSSGLVSPVVARSSVYSGPTARSCVNGSTCCQVQAVDPYTYYSKKLEVEGFCALNRLQISDYPF
ncbi:hypothetical protein TNCV_1871121 [Trichonephila clavipes]|nr:hypothetical protein TNCV_1871121 [Trichonephila clavipes]